MNCIITNINVGSQYFQKKTENSVMPIAARKIIVVKSLSFSVIFLHCFLGPTIKKVPNRLKMFPKVNKIANFEGSLLNNPKKEPNESTSITKPIVQQMPKPINL